MDRAELEALDRESLIARAESAGVKRARILTRPELVDELLLRQARAGDKRAARARGFFGVARDLLARVIERGLNLPDAAERVRSIPIPEARARDFIPQPVPTVTLAEIYATQGHRDRAIETLRGVLSREPDHAAARALLAQLEDAAFAVPAPKMPPEPEEEPPRAEAEQEEPAEKTGDTDECVALPIRPGALFVHWSVRGATLARARAESPGGHLALRVVAIAPTWDGPRSSVRDIDLGDAIGDKTFGDFPPRAIARAAIGWRENGAFVPIAHSPSLEAKSESSVVAPELLVRWTPRGPMPIADDDPDLDAIARAISRSQTTSNG